MTSLSTSLPRVKHELKGVQEGRHGRLPSSILVTPTGTHTRRTFAGPGRFVCGTPRGYPPSASHKTTPLAMTFCLERFLNPESVRRCPDIDTRTSFVGSK